MGEIKSNLLLPLDNGMAIFLIGILAILSVSNFFLYFQNRKKAYLIYSLYTFLILWDQLIENRVGFLSYYDQIAFLDQPWMHTSLEWAYNSLYILFAVFFIGLKKLNRSWYKILIGYIFVSFLLLLVSILVSINTGSISFLRFGFFYFSTLFGVLLGIPIVYLSFKYKNLANKLFITGSILFIIFSLMALFYNQLPNGGSWIFFYIAVILENIFFTLALGQKQKIISKERDVIQNRFIEQLKENDRLKQEANVKLEGKIIDITEEINKLNLQAKNDELKSLKIEYEKKMADLKVLALQAQMNPHFIFNSLNSIKLHIINNEKEEAVYYLNKFSKLIRSILSTMRKRSITLDEEIQTMKLYVEIEKIRFSDDLSFQVDVDQDVNINTIKIPPLLLQPFIENAIWHGLSPSKKKRVLKLSVNQLSCNQVEILIIDNGIGRVRSLEINAKKTYKEESIGITLTEDRLRSFFLQYNDNYSLEFVDLMEGNEALGTKVRLVLPVV